MTHPTKQDHDALARTYQQAAKGDAWHELADGKSARTDQTDDATLTVTPEHPHMPMTDVAHPDAADGEDHAVPPSPLGPHHDALMRGLEPGETTVE